MPRKVVLAVDPSPVSLDALKWATKSLCNKDDELHLISVLESGLPNDVVGESAADTSPDCKPDPAALLRTQDLLKRCKGEAQGAGIANVKMTTLVSCVGGSADMGRHITEFAEGENADMLVLGSRGMGGVRRVLGGLMGLGSVSDYVTKHSSTNVVIHKMAAPPK
ncbi:hypothetical protein CHLNCDRAFT_140327 [Chlorella variabilis]|uniref:UspA domain-containing protein n=1 Tax=Chlorella variabilis TaxID=554065 RepID=E1Z6S3_CHLVA|nr:hypothetical protein CHLNCDRAFT_140327 [Chlorella variabilis]EFN58699.1 hypothetical protein CHLNCDRAFT_140327 [Chlorella variabilis]|eukprot:XP_005850801.1 hypothetical protein CHLNCDRAFT_140327 [Chlorella variabilis]